MLQFMAGWHTRGGKSLGLVPSSPSLNHMPKTGSDSGKWTSRVIFSLWYQILQPSLKDHFISRNRHSLKLALAIRNLLEGCRKTSWNLFEEVQLALESHQLPLFFISSFWGPLELSRLFLFASLFHSPHGLSLWRSFLCFSKPLWIFLLGCCYLPSQLFMASVSRPSSLTVFFQALHVFERKTLIGSS